MSDEQSSDDAVESAIRAWQDARAAHGDGDIATLDALLAVASARHNAGDLGGALEAATQVLDVRRATFGDDHPTTVQVAWIVASWRHALGEPGAADTLRALIPTMIGVLGAEHADTLWAQHTLAGIEDGTADPAERLVRWVRLCGAETRVFGAYHHLTLTAAYGAALARHDLGDPFGACLEAVVVYRSRRRVLGEHHPDTLATRLAQVSWHGEGMGVTPPILDDLDNLIPTLERALGPDHSTTLTARYTRALWTPESAGNQMERISEWEILAEDLARARGEQDPLTVSALARREAARTEWKNLLELTRDIALEMELEEVCDDPDHPDAEAEAMATDAADAEESDKEDIFESVVAAKKALSRCLRDQGSDAYQTLLWRYYLTWRLWSGHEFLSAGQRCHRLLADCTAAVGEDHPLTEATRVLLSFNETQTWTGLAPFWDGSDAAEPFRL